MAGPVGGEKASDSAGNQPVTATGQLHPCPLLVFAGDGEALQFALRVSNNWRETRLGAHHQTGSDTVERDHCKEFGFGVNAVERVGGQTGGWEEKGAETAYKTALP